jgi:Holliday junction resolvase
MTGAAKAKGDRGEREVVSLLQRLLRLPGIRRALGAGRKDDVGDIDGVPNTAVQVAWRANFTSTVYLKIDEVEAQRVNRKVPFGVAFCRINDRPWVACMTPEQYAKMWKYAQLGLAVTRERAAAKMSSDVSHRNTAGDQ